MTQPELVAQGLNASVDPTFLRMFAEGTEQPIRITGADEGFGPQAAIEFYGTAIDTPYSDKRVYWLVAGDQPGKRILRESAEGDGDSDRDSQPQSSFLWVPYRRIAAALLKASGASPARARDFLRISRRHPRENVCRPAGRNRRCASQCFGQHERRKSRRAGLHGSKCGERYASNSPCHPAKCEHCHSHRAGRCRRSQSCGPSRPYLSTNLHSTVGFTEIHCRGRGPGCHSRLRSVTHAPG